MAAARRQQPRAWVGRGTNGDINGSEGNVTEETAPYIAGGTSSNYITATSSTGYLHLNRSQHGIQGAASGCVP